MKTYQDPDTGIKLKPLQKEDLPKTLEMMNNPDVRSTFIHNDRKFKLETLQKQLEKSQKPEPGYKFFAIWQDDELIGRVKFQRLNFDAKNASTSTFIGKDYQGNGYGTAAGRLRLQVAKDLGLKTLYARIHSDNTANIKLHEELGYKHVGTMSEYTIGKNGKPVDALIYEIKL